MFDVKELKDEDLKMVSGGVTYIKGITFLFDLNQKVRGKHDGWIYEVKEHITIYSDPRYRLEIIELPATYTGRFKVGEFVSNMPESELEVYFG